MGYNEKELLEKMAQSEKNEIVLPPKKETIGDILKNKREQRGKTIDAISDDLRIKPQYLIALEENRFNALPGQAYVIGFIKSYATYLGIEDVQKLIAEYKRENNQSQPENITAPTDENSLIEDPIINSNHIIFGSVAVLFCILLVFVFSNKNDNVEVVKVASKEVVEAPQITSSVEENVEIVLNSSLENNVKNETKFTPISEVKVEPQPTQTLPELKVEETQNNTETSLKYEIVNDEEEVVATSDMSVHTPREYGLENKDSSEIKLVAKDKVWIKLKKDGLYKYDEAEGDIGTGEAIFETILENGDVYYIPNEDNLYLTIGNAQGVDIVVDGEAIKPLSTKPVSRHNIEMNVEKLKNGTAYIRNRNLQ